MSDVSPEVAERQKPQRDPGVQALSDAAFLNGAVQMKLAIARRVIAEGYPAGIVLCILAVPTPETAP